MVPPRPRRRRHNVIGTLVILATSAALNGGTLAHSAGAAQAVAPVAAASQPTHSVTLITGDVVVLHDLGGGRQAVDVERPHGALGGVRTETIGKDLYVFPDEVLPYLAADVLDRRLFNVTSL